METAIYILIGIFVFILLMWLVSEIQIKVWTKGIEKFLGGKYNKLKKEENDNSKKI